MKVLVTGANGFVGGKLVAKLLASGYSVCACSRSGHEISGGTLDIATIGTIDGSTDWTDALQGIDTLVHTAARVHVMTDEAQDPLEEFRRVNTEGTLNLARQAKNAGIKRLVFISTVKVNGDSTSGRPPYTADDAVSPIDPYGQSKMEAEAGLRQLALNSDLEIVIVRPPLIYGLGVKANFSALARLVKGGVALPLASVTSNRRSFVNICNLVDFLILCLQHPSAANETFMVSDGEDLSTADLIGRMASAMKRKARLFPVPVSFLRFAAHLAGKKAVADRLLGSLQVSIDKNRLLLGWTPPFSVDVGLRNTLLSPSTQLN